MGHLLLFTRRFGGIDVDPDPEVGQNSSELVRLVVPRVKKEELAKLRGSRVQDCLQQQKTMDESASSLASEEE